MDFRKIRLQALYEETLRTDIQHCEYEVDVPLDISGIASSFPSNARFPASDRRAAMFDARRISGPLGVDGFLKSRADGSWAWYERLPEIDGEDEADQGFNSQPFLIGSYVLIRDADQRLRVFRVASIDELPDT